VFVECELPRHSRGRLWLDELPPASWAPAGYLTDTVASDIDASANHRSAAIEVFWFVHENPKHGLLGAQFRPGIGRETAIRVGHDGDREELDWTLDRRPLAP